MRALFDRAAVLDCLKDNGPCTTKELHAFYGDDERTVKSLRCFLYCLRSQGLVSSHKRDDGLCVWTFVKNAPPKAAPGSKPKAMPQPKACEMPEAEAEAEPHIYPRYCLEVVPPPRQNDHRHSVYTPAQAAPARAGSQDFLQYPSRGHRC
jgi:hypothetical protein